jgi:hypothetical protein
MVGAQFIVNLVTIVPRVLVTLPMVDAKAPRLEAERMDSLQEGTVGIACVDPEFDNHAWLQRAYQPESKRRVSQPRCIRHDTGWILKFKSARSGQQGINSLFGGNHQCNPGHVRTPLKIAEREGAVM